MVILVDTNIIIDVLMKREPYMQEAQEILVKCAFESLADYIVTGKPSDFVKSRVKVIQPVDLIKIGS